VRTNRSSCDGEAGPLRLATFLFMNHMVRECAERQKRWHWYVCLFSSAAPGAMPPARAVRNKYRLEVAPPVWFFCAAGGGGVHPWQVNSRRQEILHQVRSKNGRIEKAFRYVMFCGSDCPPVRLNEERSDTARNCRVPPAAQ